MKAIAALVLICVVWYVTLTVCDWLVEEEDDEQ